MASSKGAAIYAANQNAQTIASNGNVNLGVTVHKTCQFIGNVSNESLNVMGNGYYQIDASATFTGPVGNAIFAIYKDGYQVPGAKVTVTIGAADTETHTIGLSALVVKTPCRNMSSFTLVNLSAGTMNVTNATLRMVEA